VEKKKIMGYLCTVVQSVAGASKSLQPRGQWAIHPHSTPERHILAPGCVCLEQEHLFLIYTKSFCGLAASMSELLRSILREFSKVLLPLSYKSENRDSKK
jgi:predicted nucleotide-binding protein (sugar kinase/HSP70/actin superfamily)